MLGCGGGGELGPEGEEDGPGDFGVGRAKEGETVEGDVRLDGDGEGGRRGGECEGGEEGGVGAGDGGEKVGDVGFLDVLCWGGRWEGAICGVADSKVLGCGMKC